jgi:hypothetical protein
MHWPYDGCYKIRSPCGQEQLPVTRLTLRSCDSTAHTRPAVSSPETEWYHINLLLEGGLMPTLDVLINWGDVGSLESYPTLSSVALKLGHN